MAPDGIDSAVVNSLQELQFVNDKLFFFYDLENGWLHMKIPIMHDRTKGGTLNFWGSGWKEDYTISDAPNYPGYKFGSARRFNMAEGMDSFKIKFESEKPDIPDLTATCPDFIEPDIIECNVLAVRFICKKLNSDKIYYFSIFLSGSSTHFI